MQAPKKPIFKNRRKASLIVGSITALVLVAALAAALVNLYTVNGHDYARKTESMRSGVEEATKDFLGPIGGVERQGATVTQGKTLPILPCIDVSCPTVQAHWHLLTDTNAQASLEKNIRTAILEKSGSSKWAVNVIVGVLGKSEQPSTPPTDKEWFNISIWVTNSPN